MVRRIPRQHDRHVRYQDEAYLRVGDASAVSSPSDAVLDKIDYAWTGGMANDDVVLLNIKTKEFIQQLLPRTTNIRRVNDDSTTNPPTFWVGDNLGAATIKIQPLE